MPDAYNNFGGSLGNADVTCNPRIFRVTGANQNARKLLSHWFGKYWKDIEFIFFDSVLNIHDFNDFYNPVLCIVQPSN